MNNVCEAVVEVSWRNGCLNKLIPFIPFSDSSLLNASQIETALFSSTDSIKVSYD